jgi:hypothetical protein
MKKRIIFFLFALISVTVSAQEVLWKLGVHSFFDNTEFSGSEVQTSQTMAGVHLAPEIGLSWKQKHRIFAGADLLHEFGSEKGIDYAHPIVYYEYNGKPFKFYMGAIPRKLVLDRYPRMFFQDSINNYRPTINGLMWEYTHEKSYANIWLDWTSRQTLKRHEAFFMGWSGRYNWKTLYVQHFGYMFHFAHVMNQTDPPVHDNGLLLTSLGVDLARLPAFEKFDQLEANAGWSLGLERSRDGSGWQRPSGLLAEIKAKYRRFSLFNTYYKGGSQQVFYNDFGNQLYWGDPIYRAKSYDRLDASIHFLKNSTVDLRFTYSLHFTEGKMYHEQAFYATFDLDNLK